MKSRTPQQRRARNESGIAMVTALAVITIVGLLSVVATQLAFHSETTTAADRDRVHATVAAEAGLDRTLKQLSSATPPCDLAPDANATAKGAYAVEVEYYATYPVTSAPLDCDPTLGPVLPSTTTPAIAAAAVVRSKGTAGKSSIGQRTIESFVKLAPIPNNTFKNAIFANSSLAFSNSAYIKGNVGNDANIYASSAISCGNSIHIEGALIAQGPITLSNSCHIEVDAWAKGNITMSNSAKIGRDAKASGGNITIGSPQNKVGHDAIATGTVAGGVVPTTVGNSIASGAVLPDPPTQTFPQYTFNSAAWTAAAPLGPGFETYTHVGACGSNNKTNPTGVYAKIWGPGGMATATQSRVIITSCAINLAHQTSIPMAKDLAIFSSGGFTTNNNTEISRVGTDAAARRMYWIVPWGSACSPSPNGGINLSNLTKFLQVDVFFYTPCNYVGSNHATFKGQVYANNVSITNNYELGYVPLPLWGATGDGVTSYAVDTIYKREDVSTPAS